MDKAINKEFCKMTFPELWGSLPRETQLVLFRTLRENLGRPKVTIWKYHEGVSTPTSPLDRREIARVVRDTTGLEVTSETLFPES